MLLLFHNNVFVMARWTELRFGTMRRRRHTSWIAIRFDYISFVVNHIVAPVHLAHSSIHRPSPHRWLIRIMLTERSTILWWRLLRSMPSQALYLYRHQSIDESEDRMNETKTECRTKRKNNITLSCELWLWDVSEWAKQGNCADLSTFWNNICVGRGRALGNKVTQFVLLFVQCFFCASIFFLTLFVSTRQIAQIVVIANAEPKINSCDEICMCVCVCCRQSLFFSYALDIACRRTSNHL